MSILRARSRVYLSLCSWHRVQCLDVLGATFVPHTCESGLMSVIFPYLLPEGHCSSLKKKKSAFFQAWSPLGCWLRRAPKDPGHGGNLLAAGDWHSSAGAQGPPALGWGAFRISSGGIWRDASCRGPQHMLSPGWCQMVGIWLRSLHVCEPADPSSGSRMQQRNYNGTLK